MNKPHKVPHKTLVDFSAEEQLPATLHGRVWADDPDVFKLGAAWLRVIRKDWPISLWEFFAQPGAEARYTQAVHRLTVKLVSEACASGATNRLRHLADVIDHLRRRHRPADWTYNLIRAYSERTERKTGKPVRFTYGQLAQFLGDRGHDVDERTLRRACRELRVTLKRDKPGPRR